jgi:hypothetical protein
MIRFQYFNLQDQDVQRGLRDGEAGQAAGVKNQQKEEQARKWEKYEKFEKKKASWGTVLKLILALTISFTIGFSAT